MPLSYLDSSPQSIWAMQRLGDSFSNAVMGLQQQRVAQQKMAQQAALEQAYLQIAREDAQRKGQLQEAQGASYRAGADYDTARAGQVRQSQSAGRDLGWDIQQFYNARQMHDPEVANMVAAQIAQNQGVLAATHPQNIGVQVPQIMESADPQMRQAIATRTSPIQRVPQGGSLFDLRTKWPIFTAPSPAHSAALTFGERSQLENQRAANTAHSAIDRLQAGMHMSADDAVKAHEGVDKRFGGGAKAPVKVSTEEEYNALPSGTSYIAPDGSHRTKQ